MQFGLKNSPPQSATHSLVAVVGISSLLLALAWLKFNPQFASNTIGLAVFLMIVPFVSMASFELVWQKVHLRESTGLNFAQHEFSIQRVLTKYVGLLGTIGFLAFLYWLFPEYKGNFYDHFYSLAKVAIPIWLIIALPYFFWIDSKMVDPHDGYWQAGLLFSGRLKKIDRQKLLQHTLGWLIKGYFFPLMFTYAVNNLGEFLRTDYQLVSFKAIYDFAYFFLFFVDVILASMGYFISVRLLDNHIRSSEPTMSGWLVALVCYEPFWSMINQNYLRYHNDITWGAWLFDYPLWYTIWGSLILSCLVVYVWATVMFGTRFSNLTHRGIITNGPYRWTKHPAYIFKNLSWWLIAVPFLADKPWDVNLRACLLLLGLNLIYFARAKTEERHLSKDPTYQAYAHWISEYGLLANIKRLFKAPAQSH
ncbi:DUF1295 domain-containing protein [Polynucleobacter sp. MWH-Loch1C5]|uniref:methyltransferase family protein n=1 Tax=Polynucleobacter sp. MWH-Loch1C5 TaxID=2689108 RepID=UPI001C0C2AFB|nr:isoprenylcysteine carboxylmethyltransferase family protein [Polynucleobacter sp. MWH-Loch1C5]MBU3543278.1 DUF1295 domain-containing protein [Polynucleobacter sp. MWH-Loch1C5]